MADWGGGGNINTKRRKGGGREEKRGERGVEVRVEGGVRKWWREG